MGFNSNARDSYTSQQSPAEPARLEDIPAVIVPFTSHRQICDSERICFHQRGMCQVEAPQFEKTPTIQCRQEKKHMYSDQPVIKRKTTHRRFWQTLNRMHWSTTALDKKLELQFIPECFYRALWKPWPSWHRIGFMEFIDRGQSVVRFLAGCLRKRGLPTFNPLINNLHQIKSKNVNSENGISIIALLTTGFFDAVTSKRLLADSTKADNVYLTEVETILSWVFFFRGSISLRPKD